MNELIVFYLDRHVGKLSVDSSGRCYFSYAKSWLRNGFSISPRSLPLTLDTFQADPLNFEGVFGVFHDSLPDGWGTLTAIKALKRKGISYRDLSPLEKLCYVGKDGLGALTYRPCYREEEISKQQDYDEIALSMMKLQDDAAEGYDNLFSLAGSTGGARPKAHLLIDGEEWIVKFRERNDPTWMGRMEYEYALAAKKAGIEVAEARLLSSKLCDGYFATKRFDRREGQRIHVLSLAAFLESPHDLPFLDYVTYLQSVFYLTHSQRQVYQAFRRACFNVLAENSDDHAKNFAFLYDEDKGRYTLSPAYDLTHVSPARAHEMTCAGDEFPGKDSLRKLSRALDLNATRSEEIINDVERVVGLDLAEWLEK